MAEQPVRYWRNQWGQGISVTPEFYALMERAAEREGVTVEEWVSIAIHAFVDRVEALAADGGE